MSNNEKKLFKKIYDIRREELYKKNNNLFKSWLKMEDYNNISNEQKIHYFIDNILNIVKKNGYVIQFEKEFKNELATLIYNNSEVDA
tara:strand:+ start:441 stop:701 length:261 start_codon:yes stop_codon:yes gene_type:complete